MPVLGGSRLWIAAVIKAVIFDIDGTLIDSVDQHARSWVDAFAHFGLSVALDEVRGHIGEGADLLIPAFVPPRTPKSLMKEIEDFRSKLFKRKYLGEIKPFPGVRDLFEHIRQSGCKIVLGSSCAAEELSDYKAIAGISDLTDYEVSADDAGASKPSPDIFQKALEWLAPIKGTEACVVGDTKYDGEAARSSGIPFVGVISGASSKLELERSGAIAIFRDATDLFAHWDRWRNFVDTI